MMGPMVEEREVMTWERFGAAARDLTQQIIDSGFAPDVLLSITRGGLLPAGAIAYALDIHLGKLLECTPHVGFLGIVEAVAARGEKHNLLDTAGGEQWDNGRPIARRHVARDRSRRRHGKLFGV